MMMTKLTKFQIRIVEIMATTGNVLYGPSRGESTYSIVDPAREAHEDMIRVRRATIDRLHALGLIKAVNAASYEIAAEAERDGIVAALVAWVTRIDFEDVDLRDYCDLHDRAAAVREAHADRLAESLTLRRELQVARDENARLKA